VINVTLTLLDAPTAWRTGAKGWYEHGSSNVLFLLLCFSSPFFSVMRKDERSWFKEDKIKANNGGFVPWIPCQSIIALFTLIHVHNIPS